jgi:phosphate transporter
MAANVGGMASPIASPQNVISMGIMNPPPSWIEWFTIALPLCFCLDLCIWALLLVVYRPAESRTPAELHTTRSTVTSFNGKQHYIIVICAITIVLWCIEGSIEGLVGDMGKFLLM